MSNTKEKDELQRPTIKQFISGDVKKDWLIKRYFPIFGAIIFVSLLTSYLLYPKNLHYSIFRDTISGLGDYLQNPYGWPFLTVVLILAGSTFLMVTFYFYRRLSLICKKTTILSTIFFLIGAFGMFFISVVADSDIKNFIGSWSMSTVHTRMASFTFSALGIGIIILWFVFLKDAVPRLGGKKQINYWKISIAYDIFLYGVLGLGITQLIKSIDGYGWSQGPPILMFSFWEWTLMFVLFAFVFLMVLFLPEKMENQEKNDEKDNIKNNKKFLPGKMKDQENSDEKDDIK